MSGIGAKNQSGAAGRASWAKWGSKEGLRGFAWRDGSHGKFLSVTQYFREKTLAACVHQVMCVGVGTEAGPPGRRVLTLKMQPVPLTPGAPVSSLGHNVEATKP